VEKKKKTYLQSRQRAGWGSTKKGPLRSTKIPHSEKKQKGGIIQTQLIRNEGKSGGKKPKKFARAYL